MPEGETLKIGSQNFQITYKGGTGNDVVLTHLESRASFDGISVTRNAGENSVVRLQGTAYENDPLDTFKLSINWGDGTAVEQRTYGPIGVGSGLSVVINNGFAVDLTHKYANGRATPYQITLKWANQRGVGDETRLFVQVSNIPPKATITGPTTPFNRGTTQSFTFTATDPADQAAKMEWVIDWGDGITETLKQQSSTLRRSHKYTTPGDYTIRATATDRDGLTSAITLFRVTVK